MINKRIKLWIIFLLTVALLWDTLSLAGAGQESYIYARENGEQQVAEGEQQETGEAMPPVSGNDSNTVSDGDVTEPRESEDVTEETSQEDAPEALPEEGTQEDTEPREPEETTEDNPSPTPEPAEEPGAEVLVEEIDGLLIYWPETDGKGTPITPYQKDGASPEFEIRDKEGKILKWRSDYIARLKNNRQQGMMQCEIVGLGQYKELHYVKQVRIVPADIGKTRLILKDQTYSTAENAWKSPVEIKDTNGRLLAAGKDYESEIVYAYEGMENNPIPAVETVVTVTVQGKNNYAGSSISGSYMICKKDINDFIIEIDRREYTGNEIELLPMDIHIYENQEKYKKKEEYPETCLEIAGYSRNREVGLASVLLRGVGMYGGERICYFFIDKKIDRKLPVSYFELNKSRVEGKPESTCQLEIVNVTPRDADISKVVWESSDENVATVDSTGMITMKSSGTTMIKVSFQNAECVRTCMVVVKNEGEELPEGSYVTPQMFLEETDTDDTASFNRAISKMASLGCDTLYVPEGTYRIDALTSIRLKSNMKLLMDEKAVLEAIPNGAKNYHVILVQYVSNVTIQGGQIVGERKSHGGTDGEWGMGIALYDAQNVMISDVTITDCWGDGIYLGTHHEDNLNMGCEDVTVTDCVMSNNRRNNLSIVSGEGVTIDNCTFTDANGASPQFGIDIETNNEDNPCRNIVISNSEFTGNAGGSLGIITKAQNVTIVNCSLVGDFNNYAGENVVLSNTTIRGEAYARRGVMMLNGSSINTGSDQEDVLVASYCAADSRLVPGTYQQDSQNQMLLSYMRNALAPSGRVLRMERTTQGNRKSGYYFHMKDIMLGGEAVLEFGCNYRYEYVARGYGEWGIDTDQNGWYPFVGQEQFTTGITCYVTDKNVDNCRLIFYAKDNSKGMSLEIDSVKIYKVR